MEKKINQEINLQGDDKVISENSIINAPAEVLDSLAEMECAYEREREREQEEHHRKRIWHIHSCRKEKQDPHPWWRYHPGTTARVLKIS